MPFGNSYMNKYSDHENKGSENIEGFISFYANYTPSNEITYTWLSFT